MKVLHLQKVSGIGGSERHLMALLPALAAEGCRVSIAVMRAGDPSIFIQNLRGSSVPTASLAAGPDLNPLAVVQLARLIDRLEPDIVHTHLIHANVHGQLAARLRRRPGVVSLHSAHSLNVSGPYRWATFRALRLATRVIAISQHVADLALERELVHPDKLEVVHYGIDTARWSAPHPETGNAGGLTIGIAGRLIGGKGHDWLLRALELMHSRGLRVALRIAGDGGLRRHLEHTTEQLGLSSQVEFLGHVQDIENFISSCDVVVVPTMPELSEGFGLSALEAMAAGKPVVASRVGPLPEIVADGSSGLLVTPGDVEGLAAALTRLSDDALRDEMGRAARARAIAEFSLDEMVRRHLEIYDSVVRR